MSGKSRYRIRGISDVPGRDKSKHHDRPAFQRISFDGGRWEDGIPWSHATDALGQPHLRHYLYGIETRELAKLWPTSPFVDSRPMRPLKTLPLALAPYLCADKNERDLQDILNEYYTQREEITNLQNLVAVVLANKEPNWEAYGPIATAFAATFFRGSRCLRKRRERLLVKILQHPVAAHVALESGVWQAETRRLVEALAADPRLLLDYWKSPLRSEPMEIGLVHAALEAAPHLHALMPHRNAEITQQDAWQNLVQAADEHKNAMAAAFALGLQPKHGLAEKWIRQMKSNPQALYWAVRVGNWGGDRTLLPYWEKFRDLVRVDPRWGFHFTREFDSGEACAFVRRHWPDPWAVEAAVDLKLSTDWLIKEFSEGLRNSPPEDNLLTAVTLWLVDMATEKDDEE
jgi:hypothetical protein